MNPSTLHTSLSTRSTSFEKNSIPRSRAHTHPVFGGSCPMYSSPSLLFPASERLVWTPHIPKEKRSIRSIRLRLPVAHVLQHVMPIFVLLSCTSRYCHFYPPPTLPLYPLIIPRSLRIINQVFCRLNFISCYDAPD